MNLRRATAAAAAGVALSALAAVAAAQPAVIAGEQAARSQARGSDEELLKQLSNPVASLISLPFQLTWDRKVGPAREGDRYALNVQPVVPLSLNEDWNLISRTIVPVVRQADVFPGAGTQTGIGDVLQSFFFSPVKPANGWIWGAGPVFLLPTGSKDLLTADRWAAGPTGVALHQDGPWTYGMLANHVWSVGGSSRPDTSLTFVQPFVSYAAPGLWSFALNTESAYDWERETWSVPVNATVSKLLSVGTQKISVGAGIGYWVESPDGGPHGWRFKLSATFLFPK